MNYTLPSMLRIQRALAREVVDAFKKADVAGAYAVASRAAPRLYPAKNVLTAADSEKALDLLADSYLVLGTH